MSAIGFPMRVFGVWLCSLALTSVYLGSVSEFGYLGAFFYVLGVVVTVEALLHRKVCLALARRWWMQLAAP